MTLSHSHKVIRPRSQTVFDVLAQQAALALIMIGYTTRNGSTIAAIR
jgi:hypothetical protein